jgi:hypothetical protein
VLDAVEQLSVEIILGGFAVLGQASAEADDVGGPDRRAAEPAVEHDAPEVIDDRFIVTVHEAYLRADPNARRRAFVTVEPCRLYIT